MIHPLDSIELTPGQASSLALTPIRCVNCEKYVPLGWVQYATVTCPAAVDVGGHRASSSVVTNIKDTFYNERVDRALRFEELDLDEL